MDVEYIMNSSSWAVEFIPDLDHVFRRVHINFLVNWKYPNIVPPNIFRSDKDGMSVNWDKYSTAQQSLGLDIEKNGVAQLNVGQIRADPEHLDVKHTPTFENRSHASVLGITPSNNAKTRKKLSKIATWAIQPKVG